MAISLAPAILDGLSVAFSAEQLVEFRESLDRNLQAGKEVGEKRKPKPGE
jgi:hypothetical protein